MFFCCFTAESAVRVCVRIEHNSTTVTRERLREQTLSRLIEHIDRGVIFHTLYKKDQSIGLSGETKITGGDTPLSMCSIWGNVGFNQQSRPLSNLLVNISQLASLLGPERGCQPCLLLNRRLSVSPVTCSHRASEEGNR